MKAVNLIPGEQRDGAGGIAGRSGGGALIVLALIVGLVGLAVMYGSAHHQISSQSGQAAELQAQTSVIEARIGRLTPYTGFVAMANQRVQTVSELVQSRFDWSHSLSELGRVLPAGASLGSLHGTVGAASGSTSTATTTAAGATPVSSTPPGSTPVFTISGCATSQSEVAQTLQRLRLIDGATEVQLQSSTKSGSSGGSGGASGGCPAGAPAFAAQITFTGLPAAPAAAPPATTPSHASSTAADGGGKTEQVSAKGKGVAR